MNMISSSNSSNPWCQKQLSDFIFYLCPECDFKDQNQQNFIEHASNFHPLSKEIFEIKDSENNIETSEDYVDHEEEEEKTFENDQKSVTELFETISSKVGSVRFKCYK